MMCDKEILQLFFEDLNSLISPLNINYHYIRSVTAGSSNRHQVFQGCPISRDILFGHLDTLKRDRLVILKRRNAITNLYCINSQKTAGLKTCSTALRPSVSRLPNSGIQMCSGTFLQKMSSRVKSHDLFNRSLVYLFLDWVIWPLF
jgi:hypothetical protein